MHGQALFDKIVSLSGVSAVLAPGLVRRALLDGKVKVEDATAADYRAALPRLLARLRAYMPEDEAQRRARRITGLLVQVDAGHAFEGEDEGDYSLIGRVAEALRSGTPAQGQTRPPAAPSSSEITLEWDPDEVTLMGRRYTADELRRLGVSKGDDAAADPDDDPLRKTRR
ncbi:MAG: hypothetical protein M3Y87_20965 [Myxococcota bacterium]|nr:hypothetical protein [Myxococcota bacterium]